MVPKSTLLLKNSDLSQPTGLSNGYWSDLNGDGKTQALFPQTCSVEARHFPESGEHLSMHLPGWCCLVAKLRPTLCNPRDCNPEAPLPVGLPRQEYCSGLPFPPSGIFPTQGSNPHLLLGRYILYHWATWETHVPPYHQLILLVNFSTSFTHFHTRLLILFLYILDTRPLLAMWFVNIFSQTIGCLFNLFNNISCRTKVFNSNKIQFTDFFFFFSESWAW